MTQIEKYMAKKKPDSLDYILRLCSLYILIWTISPPLQHPMIYRLLVFGTALLWVLISWFKLSYMRTDAHIAYLSVCMFSVFAIIIIWISGSGFVDAAISQLQTIILLLFVLQYVYYNQQDKNFIQVLTVVAILCMMVFQIRTLIEYQVNPGVSRLLVRSSDTAQYYASQGVGGYGLVYPSVFTNAALMYWLGKCKGFRRVLLLVPLVVGLFLVLSSGFLIAVIMTLVSLGCWAIKMFSTKNVKSIIISIICLLIIVAIAMKLLLEYSNEVVSALDGTFYQVKVKEIITALQTDETTGKLEGRTSRYIESITALVKYPFVGARILGTQSELGGHSALLDMLGGFGVFSFGFYFAIYYALKSMYKKAVYKGFLAAIIILFVMNGVLNTLVGSHGIIFIVVSGVILLTNTENGS